MSKTIIIAEAGVNHNGDIELAKELIYVAANSGADYIKFQTFITELNISKTAKKADYQAVNTGDEGESQYEMVKKLELTFDDFSELQKVCRANQIGFLSTAFDHKSIAFIDSLNVDYLKIPSGEITNKPFLTALAKTKKPLIISTGMATLDEIEAAVSVLKNEGVSNDSMIVLHCNTEYPTPMKDVNLKAMLEIRDKLEVAVGYSDHTLGIEIPIAAVAMGATVIEKHFTLDRTMEGPDHAASLEPNELKQMVQSIRNVEAAISGSGHKEPSPSEMKNIQVARKSIHMALDVPKGSILKEEDFLVLRPGTGISPMRIDELIGRKTARDLVSGELLKEDDLE